jgi:glycosyltransferase involved in cell wall biosynthesis
LLNIKDSTIVHIIPTASGGGAEYVVRDLNKIFLKKKLNSFVIFFSSKKKNLNKNEISLNSSPRSPLNIFYLRKVLKKIATKEKKIIINTHLTWAYFYTVLAVLGLKNIKLYYTVHYIKSIKRNLFFFKIIYRLFSLRYSYFICVSKGAKIAFVKWLGFKSKKKLVTITNGSRIFNSKIRSSIKNRLPRLISIGSLTHIKNFSTTISAISRLKNDIECYKIIGEGPIREILEKKIKNFNLEKKVKLVGWSSNVKYHLYNSDILLIPSLSEACGLVATECMSTGLPVIASNVDGLRDVLGPKNLAITFIDNIRSGEEWKRGIEKSIHSIKILGFKKIAKLSSQQAKKFTFKKMAKGYLNVYSLKQRTL